MQHHAPSDPNIANVSPEDHLQIADALYRFCAGQDFRDKDLFTSAFSPASSVDFTQPAARLGASVPVFEGRDAVVETIFSAIEPVATTHTATNVRVTRYSGDRAEATALVEAQHVLKRDPVQRLLLKNIYRLTLSRVGRGWVIDNMRIDLVWSEGEAAVLFR